MITPRWRKVLKDFWGNKVRTFLVVLSITVGVFSVGLVAGVYSIIQNDVPADYRSANPRDAVIYPDRFDDDLVASLKNTDGVGEVEGKTSISLRAMNTTKGEIPILVEGVPDLLEKIKIGKMRVEQGTSELRDHEILIERSSLPVLGYTVGDKIQVKTHGDHTRELRIVGIVHDVNAISYTFAQTLFGYVNYDTLEWLGGSREYSSLVFTTAIRNYDETYVRQVANNLVDKVKKSGKQVYVTVVQRPGEHPAKQLVDSVIMLTAGLGVLALLLSTFLVINTVNSLLSQQIRQIGVMKALGADQGQVMGLYLVLILLFSVVALAAAIPVAGLLSYAIASYIGSLINSDLTGFRITGLALGLQLGVGLVLPVLAGLYPVVNGARRTVREAISSYGLSAGAKHSWLDTILETIQVFPRPVLISLRNTFRRKARLALTLSVLVLGGGIFIAVLNVKESMYAALDVTFGYILSDVNVDFGRSYRAMRIQDALEGIPDIKYWEGWGFANGQSMNEDGKTGDDVIITAPPSRSPLIKPVLTQGRWLIPDDENAIVVGNHYMKKRPNTHVGDTITVRIENKDRPFKVVGIYKMAGNATIPIVYMNLEYLERLRNQPGQIYSIRIQLNNNSFAHQQEIATLLRERFKELGMPIGSVDTGGDTIQSNRILVDILIYMLMTMAVLIALVGGLGLMGTMSMNVLDRTREIGVMRSIGARNASIFQIVLTEGMLIGILSWGLGALLSIPITNGLNSVVGTAVLTVPLDYIFSIKGLMIWLFIVVVLSAIASILPARNAMRLTIRDVLAYE